MVLYIICGIFLNLSLVTSCLRVTSICFIFLLLWRYVRYFYANICAIFYLSIDIPTPIFVVVFGAWATGAAFVVVVVVIGVVVEVGLVGYFPNFFLSINIIQIQIQRIMIIHHTKPINKDNWYFVLISFNLLRKWVRVSFLLKSKCLNFSNILFISFYYFLSRTLAWAISNAVKLLLKNNLKAKKLLCPSNNLKICHGLTSMIQWLIISSN